MSTNRVLHVAKDSKGNEIPCLGFNFGLTLNRKMFPCSEVIHEAEKLGIPTDVFRENTKKNSFVKAVRKNINKVLDKKGTVIHELEKSSTQIVYSVDRIVLTNEQQNMIDSDTNAFSVINTHGATYEPVTKLVYDCASEKVLCDNEDVLAEVLKLLKVYEESYEKAQFSMQLRRILSKHGDIVPWVDSGHAYFVPAKHSQLMFKLFELVTKLDPEARITRGEVPDLTFSKQTVADAANESIQDDMKLIEEKLNKLYSSNPDENKLTNRIAMNTVEELAQAIRRVEEYKILCERDLKNATGKIEEVQGIVKSFLLTGKIPEKKATVEQQIETAVDEELAELLD